MGASRAEAELEKLKNDGRLIAIYEDGELKEKPIGQIAEEALERLIQADGAWIYGQ